MAAHCAYRRPATLANGMPFFTGGIAVGGDFGAPAREKRSSSR
jgi:hypothetical protein